MDVFFVCGFSSNSRIFRSYWNVTIAGEGLQILTFARHIEQWGFHTYCDTGHPFIMVISEDTHTYIAEDWAVELSLPVSTTWVCRGWDSNTQPSACEANAQTHCATAVVWTIRRKD